jgi:hypothetical protein
MPEKNENIAKAPDEKIKPSDQPRDVANENTKKDDDTLDPGTPFPEPVVQPT